jgi:hypothetical protein
MPAQTGKFTFLFSFSQPPPLAGWCRRFRKGVLTMAPTRPNPSSLEYFVFISYDLHPVLQSAFNRIFTVVYVYDLHVQFDG